MRFKHLNCCNEVATWNLLRLIKFSARFLYLLNGFFVGGRAPGTLNARVFGQYIHIDFVFITFHSLVILLFPLSLALVFLFFFSSEFRMSSYGLLMQKLHRLAFAFALFPL